METLTVEDWATQVISVMTPAEISMIRRLGHARQWSSFISRMSWDENLQGPRPSTKVVIAEIELQVLGARTVRDLNHAAA